jgi:hypothetical protein
MHIRLEEALTLVGIWKNQETPLQVHLSRSGVRQDLRGTIGGLQGTFVELLADQAKLQLDLQGADFNGDEASPAYLVCEFPNGDRYSFYVRGGNVSSFL